MDGDERHIIQKDLDKEIIPLDSDIVGMEEEEEEDDEENTHAKTPHRQCKINSFFKKSIKRGSK